MTSFLQSSAWADFQKSLGWKVFEVGGTYVIKHDLPFGKSWLYIPRFKSLKFKSLKLEELAEQEDAIFIKAEPMEDDMAQMLVSLGFCKSTKNIQPNKTVVLDLTQSEEELLGAMHHKTRYNIRVAEKHGIHVTQNMEHGTFWDLMQKTARRDKFSSHPREYYEKLLKLCTLYIAYYGDIPVAGAMILTHGDTAYYLHGASDYEHRSLMAPYALHWQILLNLKRLNFKLYDFWGIDAVRWPGVTRFKLGWGGRVIEYPGAFDLTISPTWHWAYKTIKFYCSP